MSDQSTTPFETRCDILADLWMNYRNDNDLKDFIEYNDVGLPAAWLLAEKLCTPDEKLVSMIEETFMLLLKSLEIEEDTGFESLDDLLIG